MKKTIILRADGSFEIGMGHIYRMIYLYKYLSNDYNLIFVSVFNSGTEFLFKENNINFRWVESNTNKQNEQIKKLIEENNASLLINDILKINEEYLEFIKTNTNVKILNYGDSKVGYNKYCDAVINSLEFLRSEVNENEIICNYYEGLKYFIFPENTNEYRKKEINKEIKNILVFMGGADTRHLTLRILGLLCQLDKEYNITVILGPSFDVKEKVYGFEDRLKNLKILENVQNVFPLLHEADICFCAGGNVLLESTYVGVPAIAIAAEEHELTNINYLSDQGVVEYGGTYKHFDESFLFDKFNKLVNGFELRKEKLEKSHKLLDGQGLTRIKKIINQQLGK